MHPAVSRFTGLALAITTLSGCQNMNNSLDSFGKSVQTAGANHGMEILCGVGLVGGVLIGLKSSGKGEGVNGALKGGAIGTALGCAAGAIWQAKAKQLEDLAKRENMTIETQTLLLPKPAGQSEDQGGLVALVQDQSMFAINSSKLTPTGERQAKALAETFASKAPDSKGADQRRFLVVGHTDSTGSPSGNQHLSEQRAHAVGKVLESAGIASDRIYYQGAGSSRPVQDNATEDGRNKNRRVEISEMSSQDVLMKRVRAESSNAKYAVYSAGTQKQTATAAAPTGKKKTAVVSTHSPAPQAPATQSTTGPSEPVAAPASVAAVDFGGVPATQEKSVTATIEPKSGGFTLVSSAQASDLPFQSCEADAPRETGRVMSLATEKPLDEHKTYEYLAGFNNRVWADRVNGNLLTITPVSILKEDAAVDRQPILEVVKDYDDGNRKSMKAIQGVANTYEGETQILYRVFTTDPKAPVSCLDVVFEKNAAQASKGQVFYPRGSSAYVAKFVPIKAS